MPGLNEDTVVRQELHCHACNGYVQFDLDTAINGNHVLQCPNCGHEHCRVVKDGVISDVRWDQRNGWGAGQTYIVSQQYITYSQTSTASTTSANMYLLSASTGTAGGWFIR